MSTKRLTRSSSSTQPIVNPTTVPSKAPTRVAKRTKPQPKKLKEGEAERILHGPLNDATNGLDQPATPPSKRARHAPQVPPPETPTPAQASLYFGTATAPTTHPLESRPADPHTTSAPLKTPRGSRVVAYPNPPSLPPPSKTTLPSTAPSQTHLPPPTTTTANLLSEACAHLVKTEPKLQPIIAKHPCKIFSPAGLAEEIDPFNSLVSGIIAQQVSGAAASSIKRKFIGLFSDADASPAPFPAPSLVAATALPTLRTAGLSQRKAEYIQGLAEKFASGELSAQMLVEASDEEVLERLIAVRGLGRWSVEMFACFALKRMDVFSVGDLGVQRGMAALLGKDVKKLKAKGGKWKYMSEADMLAYSAKFAPYRSLFMWYMWRIEDVNVDAVQDA
ncbi:3-methyladenine DNA glycosylase [Trapelia coarctata]|nr:3-methyladenine DNA glycosylase [Trapelia coarctata]